MQLSAKPPKSDDKNGQEMFNWSELHSERSNFLQNPYFSTENNFYVNHDRQKIHNYYFEGFD